MIELEHICKTYRKGRSQVRALEDISLRIDDGEFVAIVGPSGSGKSTLLHILGFLDRPDSGAYLFRGHDVTGKSDSALASLRNRMVGFVFQGFHLLPRATAFDNVRLPLVYRGMGADRAAPANRLSDVGLTARSDHCPAELSGGELQRVAIARALVNDPVMLLADEPTGNLDSATGQKILDLLIGSRSRGRTLILVTHDRATARMADRVIELRDGRMISDDRLSPQPPAPASAQAEDGPRRRRLACVADHIQQAFRAVLAHKLRSALSMLGVLIGVAAIVATVTVARSAREAIEQELGSLGSNMLVVARLSSGQWTSSQRGKYNSCFTFEDVSALASLPSVLRASPVVRGRGQLSTGARSWNTRVIGASELYASMRGAVVVQGRFFTEEEVHVQARVAVVGATVVRQLFDGVDPVGQTVRINDNRFTVIGVFPRKGSRGGLDLDDMVIVPVTTAMYRIMGMRKITFVDVEARSKDVLEQAKIEVSDLLSRRHRLTVSQQHKELRVSDMTEIQDLIRRVVTNLSWLLGALSGIALVVGGTGIMNIMLVSVTERTREIGLRKALGASRGDIKRQFLIEAIVMTFLGGIVGVGLGLSAAWNLCRLAGWRADISPAVLVGSALFCVAVGVVCGLWPSCKAAGLDPIEALRYE